MISKKGEINKFKDASMFLNCGIDVFCGQLLESEICFVMCFVHLCMILEKAAQVLKTMVRNMIRNNDIKQEHFLLEYNYCDDILCVL